MPARRVRKVKTKNSQEVLQRLEEYLESECDDPVEILCGFWKDQQDAITYQELRQTVLEGVLTTEALELWQQDYSILITNRLNSMWTKAIEAGVKGQPILDNLAFEFNTQTPGLLKWINERGAQLVTACTQEQKEAIAALLTKKMREQHTVDELSRFIRPCIGLTKGDAKAVAKLYDSIIENLKKEHPRMKPESMQKKALDAACKYAERKHRQRAMTIARTESAFAYNRGADAGVRQAQEQGYLGTVKKRWSTSGDDRVCSICQALEGMEIEMEKGFPFKGRMLFPGQDLLPPAHPNCGCAVEYIEVEPVVFTDRGLSARDGDSVEIPEHEPPEYLGSLDNMSDDVVKSELIKYETEIVNSNIENAVVISSSGLVWKCFGNEKAVYPNIDLGEELYGAYVTHNHPIQETHFSFSYDDISLFMDYELTQLNGVDFKYTYTIQRTLETGYANSAELEHAYKGENYAEFLQQVFYGDADVDFDEYDFFVRRLAEKYGFRYERKKR